MAKFVHRLHVSQPVSLPGPHSHEELAAQIRVAWQALLREKVVGYLVARLRRSRETSLLRAVGHWKVVLLAQKLKSKVSYSHSFDSTLPASHQRTSSGELNASCCERLFAESREKEELRAFYAQLRKERETQGCTFHPSILRRSTDLTTSPHERLFRQSQVRSAARRHREIAERHREKQLCSFQPKVLRSRTPDTQRYERLYEV